MANLFSGINTALTSLQANQEAMQIVEQNVSNANTPGYHRQSAVFHANPAAAIHSGIFQTPSTQAIGGGVTVDQVKRYSDDLLDAQYRKYSADSSQWQSENSVISQAESLLNETGDNSLINQMDAFWSSWQTLTTDPTNTSLRQDVLDKAQGLAGALNSRTQMLQSTQTDQNDSILERVKEINTNAAQIADLNGQIAHTISTGGQPNDLLDQRDQLLDRLSEISGAKTSLQDNGEVMVSIGGHILVNGQTVTGLNETLGINPAGAVNMTWADGAAFSPPSGEIKGLVTARDTIIPQQIQGLNQLAAGLIANVNAIHTTGFDLNGTAGTNLFSGTDASNIALAITDPKLIAASSSNLVNSGDSEIARQLSALQSKQIFPNATADQYYNQQATNLGLIVQQTSSDANSSSLAKDALTSQKDALSGVSLDEEAANLVKFQRAYQAAAKVMTTIDSMLDTLINKL
jgi:flagellar hook-associated protein 1